MSATRELSIELVYTDDTVGAWSLGALARHEGVIHPDHLAPADFYDAPGGLRVATGRIFRFLDVAAAFDLVGYVRFLIASVIELDGFTVPPILADFRGPAAFEPVLALVLQQDGSRLQLRTDPDGLALDYFDPKGEAPEVRGSPYFAGLLLDPADWTRAALEALEEYRSVVGERIADEGRPSPDHPLSGLLKALDALLQRSKPHS